MGQKKSKQFGPKKLPLDTGGMELWVNHCYPVFCTQGKNLVLVFQHRNRIEQLHRNCCQAKECVLDMQVRRRTVEIGLEHLAERERWDHKKLIGHKVGKMPKNLLQNWRHFKEVQQK